MKALDRRGKHGVVRALRDNNALNVCVEDCTIELPDASFHPYAVYHFLPIGGAKITLSCHGKDTVGGLRVCQLSTEQKIQSIVSNKENEFMPAGFEPMRIEPDPVVMSGPTRVQDLPEQAETETSEIQPAA